MSGFEKPTTEVTVGEKGRVIIPKTIREELKIEKGNIGTVLYNKEEGSVLITFGGDVNVQGKINRKT